MLEVEQARWTPKCAACAKGFLQALSLCILHASTCAQPATKYVLHICYRFIKHTCLHSAVHIGAAHPRSCTALTAHARSGHSLSTAKLG